MKKFNINIMSFYPTQELKNRPFIIESLLPEGGFGAPFIARHKDLGFKVIIKAPNARKRYELGYEEAVAAFIREGKFLANLQANHPHPNIVRVTDYFAEEIVDNNQKVTIPCLVMEYVPGENLYRLVQQHGKLSEEKAIKYIRQIGEALAVCHQAGVIHRDAHPGNMILRNNSDTVVLIDFGLAGNVGTQYIKATGHIAFAPWEQLLPFEYYSDPTEKAVFKELNKAPTIDIYTLAASLYYLVTKETPTPALAQKLGSGDNKKLYPPSHYNESISKSTNDAIIKGLELEPKDRPQSVQAWLDLLIPKEPEIKLITSFYDYTKLRDLLAAKRWKEADAETAKAMLKVAGQEERGWLYDDDIDKFPCEDLRTIDQLWVKYSDGRFGFSVQKRIYQSLGGTRHYNREVWEAFGDRIGWRVNNEWLYYKDLTFSLDSRTPSGHLPSGWLGSAVVGGWGVSQV